MNMPEGWKLVPVEPTPEMMDAGLYQSSHDAQWEDVFSSWKDMLAAAPTPPAQEWDGYCPGEQRQCEAPHLCGKKGFCFRNDGDMPTPPAQEAEPVGEVCESREIGYAELNGAGVRLRVGTKLYTRPANDELRKAAEGACKFLEAYCAAMESPGQSPLPVHEGGIKSITANLRAALEEK